jgi:hypothetical protein
MDINSKSFRLVRKEAKLIEYELQFDKTLFDFRSRLLLLERSNRWVERYDIGYFEDGILVKKFTYMEAKRVIKLENL